MDIPKDVWQAANNCVRDTYAGPDTPAAINVARAILAERKRCAAIAREAGSDFYGNTDQMYAASFIASTIEATPCA